MKRLTLLLALLCAGSTYAQDLQLLTATTAATTYYVATTGLDSNPCTVSALPCLTINGALAHVPRYVRHPVEVIVGAGTFTGPVIDGNHFHFDRSFLPSGGDWIRLSGTLQTATATTGTSSGTSTTIAIGAYGDGSLNVLTDSGASWTANQFKGDLLTFTSGHRLNKTPVVVIANDATTITFTGYWAASGDKPTTGDKYLVQSWATVLNGGVPTFPSASGYGILGQYAPPGVANAFALSLLNSGEDTETVSVRNFKFATSPGIFAAQLTGHNAASFVNNWFAGASIYLSSGSSIVLLANAFTSTPTTGGVIGEENEFGSFQITSSATLNSSRANVTSDSNFATSSASGIYITGDALSVSVSGDYYKSLSKAFFMGRGAASVQRSYFDTVTTGVSYTLGYGGSTTGYAGGQFFGDQLYFSACTTPVSCRGLQFFSLDHTSGTGNTNGMSVKGSCVQAVTANTGFGSVSGNEIVLDTVNWQLNDLRDAGFEVDPKWGSRIAQ